MPKSSKTPSAPKAVPSVDAALERERNVATWVDDLSDAPFFDVFADGGAGEGKFGCNGKRLSFPAVVSNAPINEMKFTVEVEDEDSTVIEWNGSQWAVGSYALKSDNPTLRRLDQEQLGDEIHRIIMLAGLLKVVPTNRARIRLTTQIPIEFWKQRDAFKHAIAGVYKGYCGAEPFYFEILEEDIEVNIESKGILSAYLLDRHGQLAYDFGEKPVLVVDGGAHTINLGLFKKFAAQKGSTTLTNFGYKTVWQHCVDVIKARTGRPLGLDEIERAVRYSKGVLWVGTKEFNLLEDQDLYPAGYRLIGKAVVAKIHDRFKGGSLFSVVIGGGGLWPHISKYVAETFPEHYKPQENFWTVKDVAAWTLNEVGLERANAAK